MREGEVRSGEYVAFGVVVPIETNLEQEELGDKNNKKNISL